jgi:hypothetical protein
VVYGRRGAKSRAERQIDRDQLWSWEEKGGAPDSLSKSFTVQSSWQDTTAHATSCGGGYGCHAICTLDSDPVCLPYGPDGHLAFGSSVTGTACQAGGV